VVQVEQSVRWCVCVSVNLSGQKRSNEITLASFFVLTLQMKFGGRVHRLKFTATGRDKVTKIKVGAISSGDSFVVSYFCIFAFYRTILQSLTIMLCCVRAEMWTDRYTAADEENRAGKQDCALSKNVRNKTVRLRLKNVINAENIGTLAPKLRFIFVCISIQ